MGKDRNVLVELTNICVLCDGDKVLVEDKVGVGVIFPGGHVEVGESFRDAVIREMQEETGLTVFNPALKGIKDYYKSDGNRCIVTLYMANRFSGSLKSSEEGKVFWVTREEFAALPDIWGMHDILRICDSDDLSEMYWDSDQNDWTVQ